MIKSLCMIERHFSRDTLLRSFDFTFGYCIVNSVNSREAVYDQPPLEKNLVSKLAILPYSVSTDTFFFADGRLVHHIRGEYDYRDWLCSSSAGAAMQTLVSPLTLARGLRSGTDCRRRAHTRSGCTTGWATSANTLGRAGTRS